MAILEGKTVKIHQHITVLTFKIDYAYFSSRKYTVLYQKRSTFSAQTHANVNASLFLRQKSSTVSYVISLRLLFQLLYTGGGFLNRKLYKLT